MRRTIVLMLAVTVSQMTLAAAKETPEPPLQLVVSLADGSRLVGTTTVTSLPVRSEALGKMEIPLNKIRTVKFSSDHESVALLFQNGDKLQGFVVTEALVLRTVVGEMNIPLAIVTTIEITAVATDASLKIGLVAHFPFNGDADDHSGNGNHGKVVGATFVTPGLQFRGDSSSYVVVRRSDSLEPADTLTISMWVKGIPGQGAGNGYGTLLRKAENCRPGYALRGGGVSYLNIFGENPCGGGRTTSAGFRPFTETRWQHIAATYARADEAVKTYQDGELVNQTSLTQPLLHSGDLYLGGAVAAGDDGGFRGLVSEVRIYNRALSAAEIRALSTREPSGR